jgi:hypothetical protein
MTPTDDIIEGEFRVISTGEPLPRRKSPNRRRTVARIALWNLAALIAAVFAPHVPG